MKRFLVLALAALALTATLAVETAEAARMGSGRSFGAQRQAIPPPTRSPSTSPSASPTAPSAANPAAGAAAAAAPASRASRWLGPLAGLAAGIGLAALLSHFGLSEGFASVLMLMLLVFGAVILWRLFVARRDSARSPMQYAGAAPGRSPTPSAFTPAPSSFPPPLPAAGPDAFAPAFGGAAAATPAAPAGRFPPGFDPAPFVAQAKLQFRKLQAAYDAGDRKALADVLTPEMYAEIDRDIAERGTHVPTEVASLEATVLDVSTEGGSHWASVHFQGILREDGAVLPKPFDEIWNLVKPVNGKTGWLLAGIRQSA